MYINPMGIILPQLQPINESDLKIIWGIRNDPDVLKYAENGNIVTWEEIEATYKFTTYPKFVYKNPMGEILGYVEFRNDMKDDIDTVKEWSFMIAPGHRGKGWSEIMLDEALDWAKTQNYTQIRAKVKPDNKKSIHLHEKLGFKILEEDYENITYIYDFTT